MFPISSGVGRSRQKLARGMGQAFPVVAAAPPAGCPDQALGTGRCLLRFPERDSESRGQGRPRLRTRHEYPWPSAWICDEACLYRVGPHVRQRRLDLDRTFQGAVKERWLPDGARVPARPRRAGGGGLHRSDPRRERHSPGRRDHMQVVDHEACRVYLDAAIDHRQELPPDNIANRPDERRSPWECPDGNVEHCLPVRVDGCWKPAFSWELPVCRWHT